MNLGMFRTPREAVLSCFYHAKRDGEMVDEA